ncbi:MAG: hypothetical protein WBA74_02395 [Cyclobacteriaceae bacterium]
MINDDLVLGDDKHINVCIAYLIETNAFVSIDVVSKLTTLDKSTQYRQRIAGRFPPLHNITPTGRRKAYRIKDIMTWMKDPLNYIANNPTI